MIYELKYSIARKSLVSIYFTNESNPPGCNFRDTVEEILIGINLLDLSSEEKFYRLIESLSNHGFHRSELVDYKLKSDGKKGGLHIAYDEDTRTGNFKRDTEGF